MEGLVKDQIKFKVYGLILATAFVATLLAPFWIVTCIVMWPMTLCRIPYPSLTASAVQFLVPKAGRRKGRPLFLAEQGWTKPSLCCRNFDQVADCHGVSAEIVHFLPQPGRADKDWSAALGPEVLMKLQPDEIDLELPGEYLKKLRSIGPGQAKVFYDLLRQERDRDPEREVVIPRAPVGMQNEWRDFGTVVQNSGLPRYAKPMHSLRKSCIKDWAATHPTHVAMAWAGHSDYRTTIQHYLKVLEGITIGRQE